MNKVLSLLALLGTTAAFIAPHAEAQAEKPAAKKAAKKSEPAKKPARKAAAKKGTESAPEATAADEDGKEPDIAGSTHIEYQCELGNKVSIYQNKGDEKYIALRWDKMLHRMRRIETITGADRFENRRSGLVWIGIPAKGILLDAKKGQQLANECKSAAQILLAPAPATAPAAPSTAPAATPAPAATTTAPAATTTAPAATTTAPAATTTAPAATTTTPGQAATPATAPATAPAAPGATTNPAPAAPAAPEPAKDAAKS